MTIQQQSWGLPQALYRACKQTNSGRKMAEVPAEGGFFATWCVLTPSPSSQPRPTITFAQCFGLYTPSSPASLLSIHAMFSEAAPSAQNAFLPSVSPPLAPLHPTSLSRLGSGAFYEPPSFSVWVKCNLQSLHNYTRVFILYCTAYLLGSLLVRLLSPGSAILNSQQRSINIG